MFQFLQKRVAEALGLGLADAGDLQQLLDGARASGRHVEQRRVGADDVGRDVLLLRKAQPQRLERGEQVVLRLFGPFGLGFGPAPGRLVLQGLAQATFGMYQGNKEKVQIQFPNRMCGVFIDRFGKDIIFHPTDEEHSVFSVDVNVSPQFFGWIFGLGKEVKVIGPESVVEQMRKTAEEFVKNYEK